MASIEVLNSLNIRFQKSKFSIKSTSLKFKINQFISLGKYNLKLIFLIFNVTIVIKLF